MSFAENLKRIRKERGISQEELAELLEVSRQAVSRWEQGSGYPEMEKMILLSERLNLSLDELVFGRKAAPGSARQPASGSILIKSYDGKQIVNCRKVLPSPLSSWSRNKKVPQCALFGVDSTSSFWGENRVILGWYADEESMKKEIDAIWAAIRNGETFYELQYASKVKRKFLSLVLD